MAKKSFFEEKTSEESEVQKPLVKEKEEVISKRVRYISAPNVRLLVQKLNENNIGKDDIIEMLKATGDYGVIYYK